MSRVNNENGVVVRAEIRPEGDTHPNTWATQAQDGDPAKRLAFRVSAKSSMGQDIVAYPTTVGIQSVHHANSLVDWIAGDSDEVMASRPRRYVWISRNVVNIPDDLKFFVDGGYTDDDGNRWKPSRKRKKLGPEEEARP